jgi:hypothetical protein
MQPDQRHPLLVMCDNPTSPSPPRMNYHALNGKSAKASIPAGLGECNCSVGRGCDSLRLTMKTHIQIVAALHIAFGVLSLLGAIGIFLAMGMAGGIVISQGEQQAAGIIAIVAVALGGFLALLSLPGIIGGWGLYAGRSWGRVVVLVLGALHLLNVPIGTALGVYTFWALLSEPRADMPAVHAVQPAA